MAKPSLFPPGLETALRYVYHVSESTLPWRTKLDLVFADHAGAIILDAFPTDQFVIPQEEDPQIRMEAFMAWLDSRVDAANRPAIDNTGEA